MTDHEAIRRIIVSYGQFIDDRYVEGLVDLYTADGIHEIDDNAFVGEEEIRRFVVGAIPRIQDWKHLTLGSRILVHRDTADAVTDWMTLRRADDGTVTIASVGRFVDALVRTPSSDWRIKHRKLTRWGGYSAREWNEFT